MVDLVELEKLLGLLSKHRISHFKEAELEIRLDPGLVQAPPPAEEHPEKVFEAFKKQEESLPPDLRADDLFNEDKVKFWSGTADVDDTPMPLTGEQ